METPTQPTVTSASVKVMRSHDYCHFEVCLSSNDATTPQMVDELRKQAARLADKAVEQYRVAKAASARRDRIKEAWRLTSAKQTPEDQRSPYEKAIIKYHADADFAARFDYDYEDNYGQDHWFEDTDELP